MSPPAKHRITIALLAAIGGAAGAGVMLPLGTVGAGLGAAFGAALAVYAANGLRDDDDDGTAW